MIKFTILDNSQNLKAMHETHVVGNILKYLEEEEKASGRKPKKIYISLSEFGGISQEHFLEHYQDEARGTKWEQLTLEIKRIPFGPEVEITRIEFATAQTQK